MNIGILTHDLTSHNQNLLPWRTVIEVAGKINRLPGHTSFIMNASNCNDIQELQFQNNKVVQIPKPKNKRNINLISQICNRISLDILYCPVAWSLMPSNISILENKSRLKIVWYLPGAWYNFRTVFKSIRYIGLKDALPYLRQSIVPKRMFVRNLIKTGKRPLITMSDYNKVGLIKSGYPEDLIFAIPPGKSEIVCNHAQSIDNWENIRQKIDKRPYFLFFGPPRAIRGIWQILISFKQLLKSRKNICLVCLFRLDNDIEIEHIRKRIKKLQLPEDSFFCIWSSVNGNELEKFIENSYAVLKPFLIVPSEIPLAVIEATGYGKPVIGTGPDGTGCFIEQFGIMVPPANSRYLASAMSNLLNNEDLYKKLCQKALDTHQSHPTWDEVALKWLECAKIIYKKP